MGRPVTTPRQLPPGRQAGVEYVGTRLAAAILGVAERTIVRWADDGLLEVAWLTAGGHRRFDASYVERVRRSDLPDPD